jgi:hypothetical protein
MLPSSLFEEWNAHEGKTCAGTAKDSGNPCLPSASVLRAIDTPLPATEIPEDTAAAQAVKEDNADTLRNAGESPQDVYLDHGTDALSGDRTNQLGRRQAGFGLNDSAAGVSTRTGLEMGEVPRLSQLIVNGRVQFEAGEVTRIDQPQVNHHPQGQVSDAHVNPVATVGCP